MTAADVLAQLRTVGVVVDVTGQRQLRCRGHLPPDLRALVRARRDELVSLVAACEGAGHEGAAPAAANPVREMADAYQRLERLANDGPDLPTQVIARVWPETARALEATEATMNEQAAGLAGGQGDAAAFRAALAKWEAAWRIAFDRLGRACHVCGDETRTVTVVDDAGIRRCRACLGEWRAP